MYDMNINSNATRQMDALINKIDSFPNRIASIQQSGLYRSADNISQKLYAIYPASRYLAYEITPSGDLGYKLTIKPEKGMKTRNGADAFIVASVFLKGRKAYRVKSRGAYRMVLRPESVPPYPSALWSAKIPSMRGHADEITQDARRIVLENLQYAIKRFGFGPRGGSTGLSDLPSIRSRAGGR
jgi:hypothetical protein